MQESHQNMNAKQKEGKKILLKTNEGTSKTVYCLEKRQTNIYKLCTKRLFVTPLPLPHTPAIRQKGDPPPPEENTKRKPT